jgi:hypothetical protein
MESKIKPENIKDIISTAVLPDSPDILHTRESCVYFLISTGGQIQYIGRTGSLHARLKQHAGKDFDLVSWVEFSEDELAIRESVNINHYMPPLNKQVPSGFSLPALREVMSDAQKCVMRRKLAVACGSANIKGLLSEAVQHVIIEGVTSVEAERIWYGRATNTVARAVIKVREHLARFERFKEIC